VDVKAPGVVALRHPAEIRLEPAVVLCVDDVLVEVVGPGVGSHRRQGEAHLLGDAKQPRPPRPLLVGRLGEGLTAARTNLDLGVDQLALDRRREQPVAQAGRLQLLEAVLEVEDRRVEDCELLLDPDGEVGRRLEGLANGVEVQRVVLWLRIGWHRLGSS
jgi:hypothetical protein